MYTNTDNVLRVLMELCDFKSKRIDEVLNVASDGQSKIIALTSNEIDKLLIHKGGIIIRLMNLQYLLVNRDTNTIEISNKLEQYLISENIIRTEKDELSRSLQDDFAYYHRMQKHEKLKRLLAYIQMNTNIDIDGDIQEMDVWITLSSTTELSLVVSFIISAEFIPVNKVIIYQDIPKNEFNIVLSNFIPYLNQIDL